MGNARSRQNIDAIRHGRSTSYIYDTPTKIRVVRNIDEYLCYDVTWCCSNRIMYCHLSSDRKIRWEMLLLH